jgi:hypothetical protein
VWRENPSQTIAGRLEAAMLESREPALLKPIAGLLEPRARVNQDEEGEMVCITTVFGVVPVSGGAERSDRPVSGSRSSRSRAP